ncbi:Structural maintenance of chromosomes protein 5 [Aspergillus nanangensis]|uniref:Structural maintenance of chromosomes protein 5 n=1 Tax=Aspergillus nanangensis TaxID=2582783 RepID=A0AAD4GQK0_ASPNN|nr:Structural maintenance of chromosomes protein 5 [Aspergillus nanangensis]
MPPLTTVPSRRHRVEDDQDSDEVSSASTRDPTPVSQTSSGSKRRRLDKTPPETDEMSETSDDTPSEEDASTDDGSAQTPTPETTDSVQPAANGTESEADQETYRPGSIVRIKVTDFVTYTSAEFFPGPKLNMVIGPNGTGKSTLHLGRAKEPAEFVKHGCREANIEIELAGGPRFRRNPIVGRTIKREGNKSTYTLNGQLATRPQVQKLARSFSIQIDNLCQFLPQDKVSEFAALTPIELLHSTQRAAAGQEMIEWHDNLKSLRAEQKKLQADNQTDKDLLANLENRQEMQRADVDRMRQRVQIKRKIEMLEFARPIMRYKDIYSRYDTMKKTKDELIGELRDLKAELEPALSAVNAKQDYCLNVGEVISHKKRGVEEAERNASGMGRNIEEHEEKTKDLEGQIDAEKKSGQTYRQEGSKLLQTLNKLKRQLNEEPVDFDVDWYNEKIREKRREVRTIEEKAAQLKEARRPLVEGLRDKNQQVKQAEQQLQSLDSASGRQENKLKQASFDSFRAYQWLQQNQDKFEKEVFGPPIVTCSVKEPKYANAIESLLQRTDFTAFTTQTRGDFKTLQQALSINMKLHDISIRTSSVPLSTFAAPTSEEEVKALGFDGWAIDYITGPEPVLALLCSENRLHQTPISLQDISDEQYNRMESGSISSWVAGKQSYMVMRRREYGPGATSTRVRQQDVLRQIQELKDEMRQLEENMETDKAKLSQLAQDHEKCETERVELEREKSEKQTAFTNYRAIPERIRQHEVKLKDNRRLFEEMKERVLDFRYQQSQVSIQKAEATIEYANSVENLRALHEEFTKGSFRHVEGLSDLETLKARNIEHQERLDSKTRQLKEVIREVKSMSELVKKMMKDADKVVQASANQPDLRELIQTLVDYTVDQLEADIDSEKARLELTQGGSKHLIKEFEDRERQIQKLQSKSAEFQTKLADFSHAINEVRGKWEPKLDSLVESISEAFSDSFARIGCAGQVSLDKAEDEPGPDGQSGGSDFDQWSIQIHVKFRENENLSLLDSHRQSGGERAVSTIFYLMALQSLSASPFRVVDEINQGMDPRNERMVHERLVDIACAAGGGGRANSGGQYFLITPKLLSGLVYKPGMRVLCIFSGEHMPDDYGILDFKEAAKRIRMLRDRGKGKGRAITASSNGIDVYA